MVTSNFQLSIISMVIRVRLEIERAFLFLYLWLPNAPKLLSDRPESDEKSKVIRDP